MTQQGIVQETVKTFGAFRMIRRFTLTFPRIMKVLIACIRLKKRWDHFHYEQYLAVPLYRIRREFNITIV